MFDLPGNKEINYSHNSDGDIWKSFGTVYKLIQTNWIETLFVIPRQDWKAAWNSITLKKSQ